MPDRFRRVERSGDKRLLGYSRNNNVFGYWYDLRFTAPRRRLAIRLRGRWMNFRMIFWMNWRSPLGNLAGLWRYCDDSVRRFNLRLWRRSLRRGDRDAWGRPDSLP